MNLRETSRLYNAKSNFIASVSYFGNFALYFASLFLAIQYAATWYLLAPLLVIFAFSGVRLYVLQHDCGHLALFRTRVQNEWAGYGVSTFTLTPFKVMQYNHNMHHAHVGNLEERDSGEIHTMTVQEWQQANTWQRLYYRLYRNPFVLIPIGSLYTYFIRYRWPKNTRKVGVAGVLVHDVLFVAYFAGVAWLFGWTGFLVLAGGSALGGALGVFLVYLQHNFEDTYWDRKPDLNFEKATIQGSSCLDFGWVFDEAVANITKHDIHHFNPSIPSYSLRRCHREMRDAFRFRRIGFREALASFGLKLWDEEHQKLVPFP